MCQHVVLRFVSNTDICLKNPVSVWLWCTTRRTACSGQTEEGGVSAVNKRLLDGGFGGKSWLGILINHWPSGWILTSLYSFICRCCSLSCPPACSSPVYAYPLDIPPLPSSPLFGWPSSLFLSSLLFTPLPSLSVVYLTPCDSPSSRPGLLKAWPSLEPPKDPLFLLCLLNWFCWGKKKKRYIPHNLFILPFDMCDI